MLRPFASPAGPLVALLLALALVACVEPATEHRVRANAFLRGGDAAAALKECDLGLERKRGDVALLILRGKALFELDRMDESRHAYEDAVTAGKSEDPRALAEAHLGLGMIASRTRDWLSARKHFEALVAINAKDATSHLNVARACLQLTDVPCAIEHGEAAGKLRGDDEGVLYTLGTIYMMADKLNEAELTFQHICDAVPGASTCPYGLALVAARRGDKALALTKLREAIGRKVPNPENIVKEPGFAGIKDDPDFLALVATATTK